MTEFEACSVTHPKIRWDSDYNNILDHAFEKDYTYKVRYKSSTSLFEAINGATGKISYDGADEEDVINDTLTAMTSGGKLLLGLGNFDIPTGLLSSVNGITLAGTKRAYNTYGTKLTLTGNADLITHTNANPNVIHSFRLENLLLDGNNRGFSGDAVKVKNTSRLEIEGVHIFNFKGAALHLDTVWDGFYNMMMINECGDDTGGHERGQIHMVGSGGNANQNNDFSKITSSHWTYAGLYYDYSGITTFNAFEGEGDDNFPCIWAKNTAADLYIDNFYLSNIVANTDNLVLIETGANNVAFNNGKLKANAGTLVKIEDGVANGTDLIKFGNTHFMGLSGVSKAAVAIDMGGANLQLDNVSFDYITTCIQGSEGKIQIGGTPIFGANVTTKFGTLSGTCTVNAYSSTYKKGIETESYSLVDLNDNVVTIGANNRAFLQPVFIPTIMTVEKIAIWVNTQAGNIDVGIYNSDDVLIHSGSVACPAAGIAFITIPRSVLLPGTAHLSIASSDATTVLYAGPNVTANGNLETGYANTAFPLPAVIPPMNETGGGRIWMKIV